MITYKIFVSSFLLLFVSVVEGKPKDIEKTLVDYFGSTVVKNFSDTWEKTRKGFEFSASKFLKQSYGTPRGTMNVYVKKLELLHVLCRGYYFKDNKIGVLLSNLELRELPQMLRPDVSISFSNNVIRIETILPKLFIDANYILMRNQSDIIYEIKDDLNDSPFALHQVQPKGVITVIGEDCHLIGQAVVTLAGVVPHVGHTMFRVVNCKFYIEIYKPGASMAPVIAPYFTNEQSAHLDHLLSKPLNSHLASKLQGVMVSLMNSTGIFGKPFIQFRALQNAIFKETEDFMSQLVRQLNKATIRRNQGILYLPDMEIGENVKETLKITNASVNGLDLVYPSLRGGPIKMAEIMIMDQIRYYRLQVRGKVICTHCCAQGGFNFAVELLDVPISVQIEINGDKKQVKKVDVQLWRQLVFIPVSIKNAQLTNVHAETLVYAYMVQEIPKAIASLLEETLQDAIDTDTADDNNGLD